MFKRTFSSVMAMLFMASMAAAQTSEATSSDGWTHGPTTATLGDRLAEVDIPEGYQFADGDFTRQIMESMGNRTDGSEVGLIAPSDDGDWFIIFEHQDVGYVEDSDQDEIDADALFKSISDGTEAANEYRREQGVNELHVLDWQVRPFYDAEANNLIWALEAAEDGAAEHITNYNVRLLGRRGFMSVTLVTDADALERDRPEVESILAGFRYTDGNRYADFTSGDKLAGYGLTALVAGAAGAAAVKLGLFAVLAKFFGKAWKLLVLAAVGLGAGVKRMFGRGESTSTVEPQAGP